MQLWIQIAVNIDRGYMQVWIWFQIGGQVAWIGTWIGRLERYMDRQIGEVDEQVDVQQVLAQQVDVQQVDEQANGQAGGQAQQLSRYMHRQVRLDELRLDQIRSYWTDEIRQAKRRIEKSRVDEELD